MMGIIRLSAGISVSLFAHMVLANDSTGWVSTGGIQYLKSQNIRMVSEDLYISERKIRLEYEFHNDSDQNIRETVLFPLPASSPQEDGDFADIEALHQTFKIWVNNKPVQVTKNLRALWSISTDETLDITRSLTQDCGLTEQQILQPYLDSSDDLDRNTAQACVHKLVKIGVIPSAPDENALWSTQIVYSWQQTFPARTSIQVKHEYQPLLGGSVAGISRDGEYGHDMQKTYCFDKTFWKKISVTKGVHFPSYTALGYILTTGANWSKPIERFHLTIDKPKDSLMSLCWDSSLMQVSATRFEAHKTNFTPKHDIAIIFAQPANIQNDEPN